MTQQTFALYTSKGYAGDLVDSGPRVVQTGILKGSGAGFGKAMSRDTSIERGVNLGASSTTVFAISQREYNHEAGSRPTDGTDFAYLETESVSLIRQGYVYIQLDPTGDAVAVGGVLNAHPTNGTFSGGTTGGHSVVTTNIVAEEAGSVGDIIKCRIDIK